MQWFLRVAAGCAIFTLGLSACASGDDPGVATLGGSNGASPSTTPSVSPEEALQQYAQCMRDHGIDMPDPQIDEKGGITISAGAGAASGPSSGQEDAFMKADEACRDLLPQGGDAPHLSPEEQAKLQDAALAYAQCMRDHGIDMPDPDFSGGGGFIQIGGPGTDPDHSDFQAADEACRHLLDDVRPRMEATTNAP